MVKMRLGGDILKTCFLFGHSDTPYSIQDKIEKAAEYHYINYSVRVFIIGSRGNFDSIAAAAIKSLKKKYSDIILLLLLSYHPAERPIEPLNGFDNSIYVLEEKVPHRYAIVRTNQKMVDETDTIICYVTHGGNTRNLLEYSEKRQKKEAVIIENLGQNP